MKNKEAIKILLAMRHPDFRSNFAGFLKGRFGDKLTLAGDCTFANEVMPLLLATRPDLVIMDTKLYGGDSFQVMKEILIRDQKIKIIGVSESYKTDIAVTLERMGASGYMMRNDEAGQMLDLIQQVIIMEPINGKYFFQTTQPL